MCVIIVLFTLDMNDEAEGDEWHVDEKVLQDMKDSYRQVRRKDQKSPSAGHVAISDSK